ncbi:Uncharacterized protein HZ326_17248 [Fusarium oxysporum f. sp. albedinis]|nr:Uncharacterized protein HZ326_17248 [Fusarium oxysporum f. sp. albedinis]
MLSRRDSSGGPELLGVFGKIDASCRQLKEGSSGYQSDGQGPVLSGRVTWNLGWVGLRSEGETGDTYPLCEVQSRREPDLSYKLLVPSWSQTRYGTIQNTPIRVTPEKATR